jgi:hypothetical protein
MIAFLTCASDSACVLATPSVAPSNETATTIPHIIERIRIFVILEKV